MLRQLREPVRVDHPAARNAVARTRSRIQTVYLSMGTSVMRASGEAATLDAFRNEHVSLDAALTLDPAFVGASSAFLERSQTCRRAIEGIADHAGGLTAGTADIDHALLHLRSCALTLKVVGAVYSEIADFSQEMLDGITSIKKSAETLRGVLSPYRAALAAGWVTGIGAAAPALSGTVSRRSLAVPEQEQIAGLVRECQGLLADLMAGMQSGDIAFQRLDHVEQAMGLIDEAMLEPAERQRFLSLVKAQIGDAIAELRNQMARFEVACDTLADRLGAIDLAARQLREKTRSHQQGVLADLAGFRDTLGPQIAAGVKLLAEGRALMQPAGADADQTLKIAAGMRIATSEIHYMALNTNLSCSRLGGAAKSADPVTAEVRFYTVSVAGNLDAMFARLETFRDEIARCNGLIDAEATAPDVAREHDRLWRTLEANLERYDGWLAGCATLAATAGELRGFVATFEEAIRSLAVETEDFGPTDEGDAVRASLGIEGERLNQTLFALYTMNSERALHQRHFTVDEDSTNIAAVSLFTDDAPALDVASVLF